MAIEVATPERVTGGVRLGRRAVRLTVQDRIAVALMVGIPMAVVGFFVWLPTILSMLRHRLSTALGARRNCWSAGIMTVDAKSGLVSRSRNCEMCFAPAMNFAHFFCSAV